MLAQTLPPLAENHRDTFILAAERMALTLLAYYTSTGVTERSETSFKRAYGIDELIYFPRIPDGRPGFLVAKWTQTHQKKAVIAIEGTTAWAQLLTIQSATSTEVYSGTTARVLSLFRTYAIAIRQVLEAHAVWGWLHANDNKIVVCAGHSLGAACAEILGDILQQHNNHNQYKVVKFGSPRIGNAAYVRALPILAGRQNWYADIDPIHLLPQVSVPRAMGADFTPNLQAGFLIPDGQGYALTRWGNSNAPSSFENPFRVMEVISQVNQEQTPDMAWYWHHRNAYRYVFSQVAAGFSTYDLLRFRHIELPDENQWGVRYVRDAGIVPAMLTLEDPNPTDVQTGYVAPTSTTIGHGRPFQAETSPGIENIRRGNFGTPQRHRGHFWTGRN